LIPDAVLKDALWSGNVDRLQELAPCICCCSEHTFGHCPARQWSGCRGGEGLTPRDEYEEWARHYEKFHGMTRAEFDGIVLTDALEM
jgi:hypothetical protein